MNKLISRVFSPTIILAIFFCLLPWQTRYIFGWSYLSGSFTEFGTLSLYASQTFLVAGLGIAYLLHNFPVFKREYKWPIILGIAVAALSLISGVLATHSIPALAHMVDVVCALVAFVALLDKRVDIKWIMTAFGAGLLIPVAIGAVQVFGGATGASTLLGLAARDAERLGDAVLAIHDTRVLRAYGTFPHPNIFGGYLAMGLLAVMALRSPTLRGHGPAVSLAAIVLGTGLLLTASRSALLGFLVAGGLVILASFMLKHKLRLDRLMMPRRFALKERGMGEHGPAVFLSTLTLAIITCALCLSLFAPSLVASLRGGGQLEEQSLSERAEQYQEFPQTMRSIGDWIIGNGPRNYVFELADVFPHRSVWEFQPIHNVPLLIISELGLLGLLLIIAWMVSVARINFTRFAHREAIFAFGMGNALLVIAFFDHYPWSSWAGLALVALVMALMVRLDEDNCIDETKKRF